jgi:hypothetical protein
MDPRFKRPTRPVTRRRAIAATTLAIVSGLSWAGPSVAAPTDRTIGAAPRSITVEQLVDSGLTLRVSCTSPCRVDARLRAARSDEGLRSGMTLARTTRRVRGQRVVLKLRLTRNAQRTLARCDCLPRLRLSTTLTRRGRTVRRSQVIRLTSSEPTGGAPDPTRPRPTGPPRNPTGPPAPSGGPSAPPGCSSTPQQSSFEDPAGDNFDGNGAQVIPDIIAIEVALDAQCVLSVGLRLNGYAAADLFAEHWTVIFLDVDGNPATGDLGADVAIITVGSNVAPDERMLSTTPPFTGPTVPAPGGPFLYGGVRVNLAALNITAPVSLGVRAMSVFDPIADGEPSWSEYAPNKPVPGQPFQPSVRVPLQFVP